MSSTIKTTWLKRPAHCPSRNSNDSGFESRSSRGPSTSFCEQVEPIHEKSVESIPSVSIDASTSTPSSSSPLKRHHDTCNKLDEPCFKKPKLETCTSPEQFVHPDSFNKQEALAVLLINACTSSHSVKRVKTTMKFILPAEVTIPPSLKRKEIKHFIAQKMTNKDLNTLIHGERDPDRVIGTFGDAVCHWGSCRAKYETEDELSDHVMEAHLDAMRPTTPSAKIEEVCQWSGCGLSAARGDALKKYNWLVGHIGLKHTPAAHSHKCIFGGCSKRFKTTAQLHNHFRTGHADNDTSKRSKKATDCATKKTVETGNPVLKSESSFGYETGVRLPRDRYRDNINDRMLSWIINIDKKAEKMRNPVFKVEPFNPNYVKPSGSLKRKCCPVAHRFTLIEADSMSKTESSPEAQVNPSGHTVLQALFPSKPKVLSTRAVNRLNKRPKHSVHVNGETINMIQIPPQCQRPKQNYLNSKNSTK